MRESVTDYEKYFYEKADNTLKENIKPV